MKYISVAECARLWRLSERSVRNYCASGRVSGAKLQGKTWKIPKDARKPERKAIESSSDSPLLKRLIEEKQARVSGGIYHKVQIELTYNTNHIEGSRLTHEQTRYIFETATIGVTDGSVSVDDIIETVNHFRCIDYIIDTARRPLTERYIKTLHGMLKSGTEDSRRDWFAVGEYKRLPNEVGGVNTSLPEQVQSDIASLLSKYKEVPDKRLDDLLGFHVRFERIHPFQDGNGRVGRLLLFKECLNHGIVPFIITDDMKLYYYRGIKEWQNEKGFLTDTCLSAQDRFKAYMDYFRIPIR